MRIEDIMALTKLDSLESLAKAERIVCYPGASGAYYFLNFLRSQHPTIASRVIALGDKDPHKQGQRYLDLPIVSPEALRGLSPDAVLLTSILHVDEIKTELRSLLS